ncbi:MAG: 2-succinyl-5-enolpyruvyl-6-hydroxy-3-cyclohexene-1-carboxylic-acid synthase [Nocardioides sp.]|nr:2-succinyl-5-enolpyruvyl-6-hydroxy-3-cyclohexene-1-carboxylic-acid synthase [Nocardioides sp.]
MSAGATSTARAVAQWLVDQGVGEVVVAPGSRNAPLSFAWWDAAEAGLVRLHTRVDERSAAFLALGLTKVGRRAVVVCTSGTAVANLHPAVLEAAHAGLGLVALTADRPEGLRGTDANQTTDHVGLMGPLVTVADVGTPAEVAALVDPEDEPLHLNVRLDEPLLPPADAERDWCRPPAPRTIHDALPVSPPLVLAPGPRTVVVAGDDAGPPARRVAETGGWPLLAEPTSGARTGEHALRCYRLLLGATDGDGAALTAEVERVVVVGRPTLSRPVQRLLARDDVEVVAVPHTGVWSDRAYAVTTWADAVESEGPGSADLAWLDRWREADRSLGRRLDGLLAARGDLTPYDVAGVVSRAVGPGALLVVGPSNPVRDLDVMARPYPVGERRLVVANRGLAGIDGLVSTATGAALGRPHSSRALALVGDVTFLHDSNGLVRGPGQPEPDLTIVVVNDDGGSIFATLEQGAPEHADRFEALFGTPHGVDLASLCAATRTPHLRVTSRPELEQALASPNGGVEVVEAVVGRSDRRALDEAIRALRP